MDETVRKTLMQEALQHLTRGDGAKAEERLRRIVGVAPLEADPRFMLGAALAMQGRHEAAVEQFDAAIRLKPGHVQAVAQKARSLDAMDRQGEAVELAEAVGRLDADPWSLDTAGVVMTRAGRHARAAELYGRAAARAKQPGYFYNLASALVYVGRIEEAREAFRTCLSLDPNHGPGLAGLVQITRQTKEQNAIPRLLALAQRMAGDRQAIYIIGHALAKALEDIGDTAQAMAWLARAKTGVRAGHDAAGDEGLFDAAVRSLGITSGGTNDGQPIFVVGLTRTGTTLVDRILSSHSEIVSAGELNDFPNVLKTAARVGGRRTVSRELIDAAGSIDLDAVGRAYMERAARTAGGARRFVDKLPMNVFLVPVILKALPQARVICLRRHPADAVLSNYRQVFEANASDLAYTYDLEDTAQHVVRFETMIRRFAEGLPTERFMVVSYEQLVADIEGQVRGMLAFCGLGFEEACLRFHENAAPVATASAAQVREPLNAAGVGRWRRYRPAIDPALAVLEAAGVAPDGEWPATAP